VVKWSISLGNRPYIDSIGQMGGRCVGCTTRPAARCKKTAGMLPKDRFQSLLFSYTSCINQLKFEPSIENETFTNPIVDNYDEKTHVASSGHVALTLLGDESIHFYFTLFLKQVAECPCFATELRNHTNNTIKLI
jgi:hypothetical protein